MSSRRSSLYVRRGSTLNAPIRQVELSETYANLKSLSSLCGFSENGRFGVSVNEAENKQNGARIAVKIFQKKFVKQVDFFREYNFSYFLSPHQNIVETYDGIFLNNENYFFVQEFCPLGNLENFLPVHCGQSSSGPIIEENHAKNVIGQIASALEFVHSENLVHLNLCAKSVLVFAADLSKVKLSDFGWTRKQGTIVKHNHSNDLYDSPEICDILKNEAYGVDCSTDIWSLGVLIFFLLRNRYPWSKATFTCKPYYEWEQYLKRKSTQMPTKWSQFSEKARKLFRLTFSLKAKDRCTAKDVKKYLKHKWTKDMKSVSVEQNFPDDSSELTKKQSTADFEKRQKMKKKSVLQKWIASTISTMSEISEQVVSAAE